MSEHWNTVDLLRHSRHDWLNKLQLIKGNLALDRVDRANEIIDEIVIEAKNEAKLTNLNTPAFAELLLTYNWLGNRLFIEYEVLTDDKNIAAYDRQIADWFNLLFQKLNEQVTNSGDHRLVLTIQLNEDVPRFFLDFSGTIHDERKFSGFLEQHSRPSLMEMVRNKVTREEMSLEFILSI